MEGQKPLRKIQVFYGWAEWLAHNYPVIEIIQ